MCKGICGLRQHCKALNYGRQLKICNLFSDKNDTKLVSGNCFYVTDDDINIERSPCNVCPEGKVCDPASGECKVKECPRPTIENVVVLGNVHDVGSRVRYKCKSDYWMEAKHSVTHALCQNSGAYSAVPICKKEIRSCSEVKICSSSYGDGEYWLRVKAFKGRSVKIYCHNMSSATPLEYVSIDENNNYGYNAGDDKDVGRKLTKYKKIRVITETMRIERKDATFTNPPTSDHPYARATSCNCVDGCLPWKGYFKISTVGTGLKFSDKVSWITKGFEAGIENFSRNRDSTVISANCGGHCGWCRPKRALYLYYNENDFVEDSLAIHPECL